MILSAELAPVFIKCLERYEAEKDLFYSDYLAILREEITTLLKTWGSWKPLESVHRIDVSPAGVETRTPTNLKVDPNFFDDCMTLGRSESYVSIAFKTPEDETVKIKYHCPTKKFEIVE